MFELGRYLLDVESLEDRMEGKCNLCVCPLCVPFVCVLSVTHTFLLGRTAVLFPRYCAQRQLPRSVVKQTNQRPASTHHLRYVLPASNLPLTFPLESHPWVICYGPSFPISCSHLVPYVVDLQVGAGASGLRLLVFLPLMAQNNNQYASLHLSLCLRLRLGF